VREYVKSCGCEEILNGELLGVWDNVESIDWDSLPQKFVLKCNHGGGYNLMCDNKEKLNIDEAKVTLNKWLKEDYWLFYAETNYKDIPKKIICEKYIDNFEDISLYVFNGNPEFIMVYTNKVDDLNRKRTTFDLEWNMVSFIADMYEGYFIKPPSLDKMIADVKKLSQGIPFVRVDFYLVDEHHFFGEMTFTPTGCLGNYFTEEYSSKFADLLKLEVTQK
jgi:hypothetical protein